MKTKTRKEIRAESRQVIRDCVSQSDAISAGLRIAATLMFARCDASADGCVKAADDMSRLLTPIYRNSSTLSHRLSRLVTQRDWESLWLAARREIYPTMAI